MFHYWSNLDVNMKKLFLFIICMVFMSNLTYSQGNIKLPVPEKTGGKALMDCFNARHTGREFSSETLDLQTLSNLLWAAFGINRAEDGKRTAPSAMNMQEMSIYCAMENGLFLYDAATHTLIQKSTADIRQATGKQEFVPTAPLNLIFVADKNKMEKVSDDEAKIVRYAALDTGFIAQNVYLYCASANLETVVRGYFDKDELTKAMHLESSAFVVLTQTVGKKQ